MTILNKGELEMRIIERDIAFYIDCREKASFDLMWSRPDDEKRAKEIRDAHTKIISSLNELKTLFDNK